MPPAVFLALTLMQEEKYLPTQLSFLFKIQLYGKTPVPKFVVNWRLFLTTFMGLLLTSPEFLCLYVSSQIS